MQEKEVRELDTCVIPIPRAERLIIEEFEIYFLTHNQLDSGHGNGKQRQKIVAPYLEHTIGNGSQKGCNWHKSATIWITAARPSTVPRLMTLSL